MLKACLFVFLNRSEIHQINRKPHTIQKCILNEFSKNRDFSPPNLETIDVSNSINN